MRVELQDIYENCLTQIEAETRLTKFCSWMMYLRFLQMKKWCVMISDHCFEMLYYLDNHYTNAILKGMNSIIPNIKRRAMGFRNDECYKIMNCLVFGNSIMMQLSKCIVPL